VGQILTLLASDVNADNLSQAITVTGGSVHLFVAPSVMLVSGDLAVRNAINQTAGVLATLSDDEARALTSLSDLLQFDVSSLTNLVSAALNFAALDEATVLPISGWIYSLSQQYANRKQDRARVGERWEAEGGCVFPA
jgi:hypothetical protein